MEQQTVYIKGMVCKRCESTVEQELKDLGHKPVKSALGEVSFISENSYDQEKLEERLRAHGFSLLQDKKSALVKAVKLFAEEVYSGEFDFPDRFRFAELLKSRLQKEYDSISDIFIAAEKKSIEQYIIGFRINKVKEFLVYTNMTLADIAFKLNFNSVAHLSSQFKQQTGLTPSFFKNIKKDRDEAISK
jgi:AraC family transcriptional regulator